MALKRWSGELLEECKRTTLEIAAEAQPSSEKPATVQASEAEQGLQLLPLDTLGRLGSLARDVFQLVDVPEFVHETDRSSSSASTRPHVDHADLLERLDAEISRTYQTFYDFVYQDLPYCWRQLYTDLSILKFNCLVSSWHPGRDDETTGNGASKDNTLVAQLVKTLDKALVLAGGAGLKRGRQTIERMLHLLEETCCDDAPRFSPEEAHDTRPTKRARRSSNGESRLSQWDAERSFPARRIFTPEIKNLIAHRENMTMDDFQRYMDEGSKTPDGPLPLVIWGLIDDWPAMTTRPWKKPGYLLSRTFGGRRLVPVEVGRTYVDEGWTQELITFRELLDRFDQEGDGSESNHTAEEGKERSSSLSSSPVTYLAQHELFTQLPSLRNDILTPDLCHSNPPPHPVSPSLSRPAPPVPLMNAWLGPAGTITPLHTDGYHNLLAQVVGAKYVRLYSPLDTEALCPCSDGEDDGTGIDMSNTSTFDVGVIEGWDNLPRGQDPRDPIELEEFRSLRCWECVLEEGDVLYIPVGWWHYVRSLSVSFSVSFWWSGEDGTGDDEEGP
ncbi:Clavaminate synthase-like protein [Sodiomyces alkalinus F11]|uniref:Clavaminate synthase-like protein n=1 Tax=Sodiomyces alkalinus (strain CBS 110278 / VKM F-3762 / F11) TaxID=1314773 RepID=A0A3N2Q1I2_SODAK|nr:Clavaminate synthase-like protein [Sodiomyces alkalinus F11]ROT40619.1 Clavaminate synthase-like protein [Sodiomyces alkalinus F11]